MKRFAWRLQHVLDIRTREEQTKRSELLKLTEKLAETRSELLARQRLVRNMILSIAQKSPGDRLSEQEFFLKHSVISERQIKELKNTVSRLESQQRTKMAEVLKVRRSKDGLEKLRGEAKRRYIEEQEKLEQKELDEAAGISFARSRTAGAEIRQRQIRRISQ